MENRRVGRQVAAYIITFIHRIYSGITGKYESTAHLYTVDINISIPIALTCVHIQGIKMVLFKNKDSVPIHMETVYPALFGLIAKTLPGKFLLFHKLLPPHLF